MSDSEKAILKWCRAQRAAIGMRCLPDGVRAVCVLDRGSTYKTDRFGRIVEPREYDRRTVLYIGSTWDAVAAEMRAAGIELDC